MTPGSAQKVLKWHKYVCVASSSACFMSKGTSISKIIKDLSASEDGEKDEDMR